MVTMLHVVGRVKLPAGQEPAAGVWLLPSREPPRRPPAWPSPRNPTPHGGLGPFLEVSLSRPALLLGGNGHRRRRLQGLRRAENKGGKVLHTPIPEAWESPRGQVEAPAPRHASRLAFCSPGRAWLEAHSGPLLEPDRGCPIPPPPRGPRPLAFHRGEQPAEASVNLQPKKGAPLRGICLQERI